jgi:gliding motility-associated-like protein
MKNRIFLLILLLLGSRIYAQTNQYSHTESSIQSQTQAQTQAKFLAPQTEQHLQFKFLENKNQWDKEVKFRANVPNGMLYLKNNSLLYSFFDASSFEHNHQAEHKQDANKIVKGHGVEVKFLGANATPAIQNTGQGTEAYNFYLGNNPEKWASNVKSYTQIGYKNLYEGVDMRFYTQDESLKYEFIVAPNTNTDKIRLEYIGASAVAIENGNLKVSTTIHDFMEEHPYCYQEIEGQKIEVPANFVLQNNVLSYEFPQGYNKNYTLVIDPTLLFSSYSGSISDNWGFTATFDNAGNLYAGGITNGQQIPLNIGAFDISFNGNWDVAIFKFNATGSNLLYGTFLGGAQAEQPSSMVVNNAGNLVIMGSTGSTDFPTSLGAFDRTFNGGTATSLHTLNYPSGADIYLTTLSSTGSTLVASTYVGGNGNDGLGEPSVPGALRPMTVNYGDEFRGDVAIDANDNVYVASVTRSTTFPVTSSVAQGQQDGVAFRLNANFSSLNWGTYIGGTQDDAAFSIKVATNGDIFICGGTVSNNIGTTAGAYQPTLAGGAEGYVRRYNNAGILQNSTYLGTTGYDVAFMLDLDFATNDVYIFGNTTGTHPISTGVYNNPNSGHFIYKFNNTLSTRLFSTQIGAVNRGQPSITPTAFMVNDCGNIYLSGWGGLTNAGTTGVNLSTSGLQTTSDALRGFTDGDDFYIMILGKNASSLLYATFFGGISNSDGDHVDGGTSRFSRDGVIYHSVCACRDNRIPITAGAWSTTNPAISSPPAPYAGCNNAVFKINMDPFTADFAPINTATGQVYADGTCAPVTIRMRNLSRNATVFQWNLGSFGNSTLAEPLITITQAGTYTFTMTVSNPELCFAPITITKTINVQGGVLSVSPNTAICNGQSANLVASGGTSYIWSPATGLSNPNIANPIANPATTTTYTVVSQVSPNCRQTATVTVTVTNSIEAKFDVQLSDQCSAFPLVTLINQSAAGGTYTWDLGNGQTITGQNPAPFRYTAEGVFAIKLTTNLGSDCPNSLTKSVTIQRNTVIVPTISPNAKICVGDFTQLIASGGSTYTWTPTTGLNNPNIANPIASPTQTTIYKVRIGNNATTCFRDTTVTVSVSPVVTAKIALQQTKDCDLFPLITLTNQSVGATDFLWNFGNGQTSTAQTPAPFRYAVAGNYRIILTARNTDCSKNDTMNVKIDEITDNNFIKLITLSPDQKICAGESANLSATGGVSYLWTPNKNLSSNSIANPIASPTETTRYTVRISNSSGCFKDTSILVDVAPKIVVDFDVVLEELCEPYPLVRIVSRVSGADTYLWTFDNGTTFEGTQPPPYKYTADGTYNIKVVAKNRNCEKSNAQQSIQKRIIANDFYRSIRIIPRSPSICAGDKIQLNASGGFRYQWTPSIGLSSATVANPVVTPSQTTSYNVRIFNERGCFVDSTVTITVVPEINADFEIQVSSECGKNGTVKFVNKSTGTGEYSWSFGDGNLDNTQNPSKTSYEKSGEYEVILQVFNGVCRRSKTQKIKVENVIPPNVITPNGDGKNERFVIDNVRNDWKVEIYDRWGKQVFKSDNYQNDWGADTTNALYYYLLTSPEGKTCKGWIMVLKGTE